MTDETNLAAVATAIATPFPGGPVPVVAPVAVVAVAKPSLLSRLTAVQIKLHTDWKWIISRSWSIRFIFLAFVLSGAEVFLPLFVGKTSMNPVMYAGAIALVTGAAFVARLVAQNREAPNAV